MSAQHHQTPEEIESQRRLLQEFLGTQKPSFPQGKIRPDDQGEIAFAVAADFQNKVVIIRFAKPVDWIGLDAKSAKYLATLLNEKAIQLLEREIQS